MSRRAQILFVLLACLIVSSVWGASPPTSYWQLVFQYDGPVLQLLTADRIPPISKSVRTPGLASAPVRLTYECQWLDGGGQLIHSGSTQLPLGLRSALGEGEPCRVIMPDEGVIVVRLAGPDQSVTPSSIRLTDSPSVDKSALALPLPAAFEHHSWTFPLPAPSLSAAPMDGPLAVIKMRDTGPDLNRLVIVVMGDGYTLANYGAGRLEADAAGLEDDFEAKAPWDVLFSATNMYRLDIESNEEGADHETYGVLKDTYLNSSFWVSGIERLLALTGDGYSRAVAAADVMVGPGVWDLILVLVNSTKYGGSGGAIAVSSVNSASGEVVLHELGHSFAGLADEYETAYPGYPPGDWEPNVDYDYDGPGLKWLAWVEPGTPLPTPETSPYYSVVGAFEGARYLSSGIYRPWYNCLMRSLNRPFCPVCREAHVIEFTDIVMLADDIDPLPETMYFVGGSGRTFSTTPLPFGDLTFEWSLDGIPIPGETSPTLLLTPEHMAIPLQTLELEIVFATDLVRKETIAETYSWTVLGAVSCCKGIVGDANFDGSYKPTIGDITTLIDHLFVSEQPLLCYEEADANQSGGLHPTSEDITIGDITHLVDHLFVSEIPLAECL